MREIRFRAYYKPERSMLDWEFLQSALDHYNKPFEDTDDYKVMQYTGLKDKNGVEIYEGDIVEEPGSRYEVVYHADGFYMRNMYEPDNMLIQLRHGYLYCEVIGNIYEHGHLLEVDLHKAIERIESDE